MSDRTRPPEPAVVIVTPIDPWGDRGGFQHVVFQRMEAFERAGFDVHVVSVADRVGWRSPRSASRRPAERGVRRHTRRWSARPDRPDPRLVARSAAAAVWRALPGRLQKVAATVRTTRRDVDHVVGRPLSIDDERWTTGVIGDVDPVAVICETPFVCSPAWRAAGRYVVVCAHDVIHERLASLQALGYRTAPSTFGPEDEADLLAGADEIVAIQPADAAALRRLAPGTPVSVIPAGFTVHPARGEPDRDRVLFVGSAALPNVDGLEWFLTEVWPTVVRARPAARLDVVGSVAARVGTVPTGVTMRGVVDDLDGSYRRATVVVVPLRTGSGLKVKLVEALAHGRPVVSTSVGVQGLDDPDGAGVIVADDPGAFADATVGMLADDADRRRRREQARAAAAAYEPVRLHDGLIARIRAHAGGSDQQLRLTVAVCTFRRPNRLARLLGRLAEVTRPDGVAVRVLVVDNDPAESARPVVAAAAGDVDYLAVSPPNISVARNAAIAATAGDDGLIFLDDDELPAIGWLDELVAMFRRTGADVVTGPVDRTFDDAVASWQRDMFLPFAWPDDGAVVGEAITGNVLIRRSALDGGVTFDPDLGRAGGEDQVLFRQLAGAGRSIRFAARAQVDEAVEAGRLSPRYVVRLEYRKGTTLGLIDGGRRPGLDADDVTKLTRLAKAGVWMARGALGTVAGTLRRDRGRRWRGVATSARGAGMVAGLWGRTLDLYDGGAT